MKSWWAQLRLEKRLYILLAGVTILTVAIWIVGASLGGAWASNVMPNFLAEWTGLLFAVAVIERLVTQERDRRNALELAPLRQQASAALGAAFAPLVNAAVTDHAAVRQIEQPEAEEPIADFLVRWFDGDLDGLGRLADVVWLEMTARTLEETADRLDAFRRDYGDSEAVTPSVRAALHRVPALERASANTMAAYANDLDPEPGQPPAPFRLNMTPERVTAVVKPEFGARLMEIRELVRSAETLLGSDLSTRDAWSTWRLLRLVGRIVARREDAPDAA